MFLKKKKKKGPPILNTCTVNFPKHRQYTTSLTVPKFTAITDINFKIVK